MATKKRSFLKNGKAIAKDAPTILTRAGERGVGYFGAKVLAKQGGKFVPEKAKKFVGPGLVLLGTVMDVATNNEHVRAIGQGMAIEGMDRSANEFLPEKAKDTLGLSGVGATGSNVSQEELWDEWAAEAEAETAMDESEDDSEDLDGVADDEDEEML